MGFIDNDKCGKDVCKPEPHCDGKVVEVDSLCEATNWPAPGGNVKIPVVISEFTVQIDCEAKIQLCEPAFEIKRIHKNVYLTQCRLVAGTNKVFIKGYVRKNIEYATKHCTTKSGICADIKDTTVYVPFQCVTEVDFCRQPDIKPTFPTIEAEYFDCKLLGKDPRETDRAHAERFNEKVYAELVCAEIYEADIINDGKTLDCFPTEKEFTSITEKMVVYVTIKLLQLQQVWIKLPEPCEEEERECTCEPKLYPAKYRKNRK